MMARDDGGPAFPTFESNGEGHLYCSGAGMSLRDYFAAHAPEPPAAWHGGDRTIADCIAWRWHYADAMLKERAK